MLLVRWRDAVHRLSLFLSCILCTERKKMYHTLTILTLAVNFLSDSPSSCNQQIRSEITRRSTARLTKSTILSRCEAPCEPTACTKAPGSRGRTRERSRNMAALTVACPTTSVQDHIDCSGTAIGKSGGEIVLFALRSPSSGSLSAALQPLIVLTFNGI